MLFEYFPFCLFCLYLKSMCACGYCYECCCCGSLIRRCKAVNDTGWWKLSSWWDCDRTHKYNTTMFPFPLNLPLCGVTSRSSVFCDKFGQMAIISFRSSASIWCLSAPPGQPGGPRVPTEMHHTTFAPTHTHANIPHVQDTRQIRYRPKGSPK